jgi:hypothetical protein
VSFFEASGPIPKFASLRRTLICELRYRRTPATYPSSAALVQSPDFGLAARMMRTSEPK